MLARTEKEANMNLLKTITHELRTPLNILLGFMSMIEDKYEGVNYEEFHICKSMAKTLAIVTNSFVDLIQIWTDNIVFKDEMFSLTTLISQLKVIIQS